MTILFRFRPFFLSSLASLTCAAIFTFGHSDIAMAQTTSEPQNKPLSSSVAPIKKDNKKTSSVSVESKNGQMIVKEDCPDCYPRGVLGMRDTPLENQERSVKFGTAAQYLLAGAAVDNAQIDKLALAKELNDFVRISGEYFKTKPDYKGVFVAVFAYYPGYEKPYQITLPANLNASNKAQLTKLNQVIKNESQCNREKFCSLFAVVAANYTNPLNTQQKVDKNDFGEFMKKNSATQNVQIFHKNKNYKEPVMIILYQGVNGYLASRDYVKEDMLKLSQDLKDLKSAQDLVP